MKIFLTGEGPTDCGKRGCDKERRPRWEDGPVQIYIHKILPDAEILTVDKYAMRDLSAKRKTKRTRAVMRMLEGHGEKAFFVAQIAMEEGCDVAAMYVDADKGEGPAPKDESSCRKRYEFIKGQVLTGLLQGGAENTLAIVPMKMIECWILGDREAFTKAFGVEPTPSLLKSPELIWGDKQDPNSDYPKHRLEKVLKECGKESCQSTFVSVAEHAELETLCKSCPISFADFVQQLSLISE